MGIGKQGPIQRFFLWFAGGAGILAKVLLIGLITVGYFAYVGGIMANVGIDTIVSDPPLIRIGGASLLYLVLLIIFGSMIS